MLRLKLLAFALAGGFVALACATGVYSPPTATSTPQATSPGALSPKQAVEQAVLLFYKALNSRDRQALLSVVIAADHPAAIAKLEEVTKWQASIDFEEIEKLECTGARCLVTANVTLSRPGSWDPRMEQLLVVLEGGEWKVSLAQQ